MCSDSHISQRQIQAFQNILFLQNQLSLTSCLNICTRPKFLKTLQDFTINSQFNFCNYLQGFALENLQSKREIPNIDCLLTLHELNHFAPR